jgi:hypothetical protein
VRDQTRAWVDHTRATANDAVEHARVDALYCVTRHLSLKRR